MKGGIADLGKALAGFLSHPLRNVWNGRKSAAKNTEVKPGAASQDGQSADAMRFGYLGQCQIAPARRRTSFGSR